ncbi:MAG: polysaccharide deacetylase family protein [Nanoarchaeota archaeon]
MLNALSFGVKVQNLGPKKEKKYPFLVAITVDTESGYVDGDERRAWQKEKPDAFEGYYYGIRNLLYVFDRHKIKSTFFLSTQCFSAKGNEKKLVDEQLKRIIKNRHEIGLHLHPDSEFSLQKKLSKNFNATSAFFYTYQEKLELLKASRELIKENLGKNIEKSLISFRWGNWALDSDGAKALNELGFKIDSSATPGIKGHSNDTMKYDWSNVSRHYPWKLSITNYRDTNHNNSNISEIPIATFSFFGAKLRADPVNSILLNKAFAEYYNKADRSKKPFVFVIITHSSEATMKDGKETKALQDLESFIKFSKKYKDVKFVTMKETYEKISVP